MGSPQEQGALTAMNYGRDYHPRFFSMFLAGAVINGGKGDRRPRYHFSRGLRSACASGSRKLGKRGRMPETSFGAVGTIRVVGKWLSFQAC